MDSDPLRDALDKLQIEVNRGNSARAIRQASNPERAKADLAHQIAKEPSIRKTIDEACRYWVKHGAWPMMDPDVSLFVWDRIWEAYMFAAWIYIRGFRHSGKTESELLDFLLIENWEGMGLYRFQARLIRLQ